MSSAASSSRNSVSSSSIGLPAHVRLPLPGIPRRVSYVLPTPGSTASKSPVQPLQVFDVPAAIKAGEHRQRSSPLLIPTSAVSGSLAKLEDWDHADRHPRHTLAVTSLAIDATTRIQDGQHQGSHPEGILYTGGRDGLICAWELGLPMRETRARPKKKRRRSTLIARLEGRLDEEDDDDPEHAELDDRADDIATFELDHDLKTAQAPSSPRATADVEESDPGWELDPVAFAHSNKKRRTKFRQCLQSHTDWINDIILCNQNQTVISASSDRTVKMWNPHSAATSLLPSTLGAHSDYVRCLAHAPQAGAVISAGLDRTVKIWDLGLASSSGGRDAPASGAPIWELSGDVVKESVYALAATPNANLIAVGTPARTIRLWDPRARSRASPAANLIGHTDNVRALVISADGRYLLSGSSDSTIRLWSVAEQRCLHTFTHHADSVWSLFSPSDNLDVFYSGDRRGYLCKVDMEGCGDMGEADCIVLAQDTASTPVQATAGIQKIVAFDHGIVWTASGSSNVQAWRDVPSRLERESKYPVSSLPSIRTSNAQEGLPPSGTESFRRRYASSPSTSPKARSNSLQPGSPDSPSGIASKHPEADLADWQVPDVPVSMTLHGLPFKSLVSVAPANDLYGATIGLGSTSVRDLTGALGRASLNMLNASRTSFAYFGRGPSIGGDPTQHHPAVPLALAATRSRSILDGHTSQQGSNLASSPPVVSGAHVSFQADDVSRKDRTGSVLRFASHLDIQPPDGLHHGADDEDMDGDGDDKAVAKAEASTEARLAFEDRDLAADATPLRPAPMEIIEGAHGLIRCSVLNDRRHVLTMDTRGRLAVWDILAAQMLGIVDPTAVVQSAVSDEGCQAAWEDKGQGSLSALNFAPQAIPAEVLELVKARLECEGACAPWCNVDVKNGALTVHLEEPRCFDAEIYLDECAAIVESAFVQDDRRINMGKWVLRNLLHDFITAEIQTRVREQPDLLTGVPAFEHEALFKRRPSRTAIAHGQEPAVYTPGITIPLATTAKSPAIARPTSRRNTIIQSLRTPAADQTPLGAASGALDYFSMAEPPQGKPADNHQVATPVELVNDDSSTTAKTPGRWTALQFAGSKMVPSLNTSHLSRSAASSSGGNDVPLSPSTPTGSFMGRLRAGLGSRAGKDKTSKATETETTGKNAQIREATEQSLGPTDAPHVVALRQLLARPLNATTLDDFPPLRFDPEMSVIISEAVPDTASWDVVYRGVVGCTGCDVSTLELTSPTWLLEFSLASRTLARDQSATKLSFTLHPWVDPNTSNNGGQSSWQPGQGPMPALPSGNVRLSATRMLRMRKISMYVCEKLELLPPRKHADSIAGSVRSNNEGTRTPHGLSMTSLSRSNGSPSAAAPTASTSSLSQTSSAANDAETAEHEQARLELARSIEILHGGIVLPPEMTLAQCQRFYHRTGGDIKLEYRQRVNP